MHRIVRVIGVVLALCAATLAGSAPVGAASSSTPPDSGVVPAGFSAPQQLVHGVFDYLSEVVDSTNHVHIAATGKGGLWYLTDRTGSWSVHRILVSLHNKSYFDPSIALDDNDRVYIAVVRQACDNCAPGGSDGIFFVTDKGRARGTFPSSPSRIGPNHSGSPSLKVSSGHIYLAYEKICCLPGDPFKLILKTNATGAWTRSLVTGGGRFPSLRIGTDGHARVAFEKAFGIGYAVAATTSGSFSSGTVPGTSDRDVRPLLALDSANRAHIVYGHISISSGKTVYNWQTSGGWHGAVTVTHHLGSVGYDLDTLGRPNVAVGNTGVNEFVLVSGSWTSSTVASLGHVRGMALRRAFNGHVVIVYSTNTGIDISRN